MLDSRGIIKKFKHAEVLFWSVQATFTKYCMSYEPELLNAGFKKMYLKTGNMTKNEIILCDIWERMLANGKTA